MDRKIKFQLSCEHVTPNGKGKQLMKEFWHFET